MGNFGVKIGSNLNTNTDLQVKFTTKFSSLKILKLDDAELTTNGSGVGSVVINHGLGYTPICVVMKKFTAQYSFLSGTSYTNAFRHIPSYNSYDNPKSGFTFDVDDENLTISTENFGLGGASASTTYYFRYYILVDVSDDFTGISNLELTGDIGFKNSKDTKDVFTSQEYEMKYSSKYKALQFYDDHLLTETLTLPPVWATISDSDEEEATYVDFNHSLNYPPFFLLFTDYDIGGFGGSMFEAPGLDVSDAGGGNYDGLTEISAWSDEDRVRVLFRRYSEVVSGVYGEIFAEKTINIYVIIFAENLLGEASP